MKLFILTHKRVKIQQRTWYFGMGISTLKKRFKKRYKHGYYFISIHHVLLTVAIIYENMQYMRCIIFYKALLKHKNTFIYYCCYWAHILHIHTHKLI